MLSLQRALRQARAVALEWLVNLLYDDLDRKTADLGHTTGNIE
jgi:hypothetical protein